MTIQRDDLKKRFLAAISRYFLPLMLGAVVMNIILTAYMRFNIASATLLYIVYEIMLFAFFEWLKPKKVIRGFVYIAAAAVLLLISRQLLSTGWYSSGVTFIDWFYVNITEVGSVDQYLYFIFLGLGFFITSILYYFTVYRYRTFGTMLIILFPFVIYGKRDDTMNTFKLTLMLTVFLALMVHQRLVTDDVSHDTRINSSYVIGAALFVTLAGAVTMFVPKPEYKSQLELDPGIFDMDVTANETEYDDLSEESSPRFGANATGEVLFRMKTSEDEDVVYLRRQSFDSFEDDRWQFNSQGYYLVDSEEDDNEINSPVYVYNLMKTLAETGRYEQYGLTEDLFDAEEYSQTVWANLSSTTYSPSYIPAPLMINTDPLTYCYKTVHGEVYYEGSAGYNSLYGRYNLLGASYGYYPEGESERAYYSGLDIDWDTFIAMLTQAYYYGDITSNQYYNFETILSDYTQVYDYSQQMEELAYQITEGCNNDYERAQAFVDYFEYNGYTYDLEYEPEDESIDYFLFESKTGSCTSYATSMTLMARIVGLPARYVEGFAAYEKDDDGNFIIRDSHAHAFVEVYLAGAGWVTFDPTVPGYMQDYSDNGGNAAQILETFMEYFSRIVLFMGVIFVLIFIVLLDRIIEVIFRISLRLRKDFGTKAAALYKRTIHLLELSSRERLKGFTANEISDYALVKRQADISFVTQLFERICFGGYCPTKEEYEQAYRCYKAAWRALSGKVKKKGGSKKNAETAV